MKEGHACTLEAQAQKRPRHSGCNRSAGVHHMEAMMEQNDVVIKGCDEVSVYVSDAGYVCIEQGNDVVAILPQHASAICKAIRGAAKEARAVQGE